MARLMSLRQLLMRFFLEDVTFSKFSDRCSTGRDMVIAPNFQSDDGNHRMEVSTLTFVDVDEESKIFYPRSNLGYSAVKRHNFFFLLNFK